MGKGVFGGLAGVFNKPKSQARIRNDTLIDEANARAIKAEDEKKKKAALKLAQLTTGAGGVLSDAPTGRRTLLGN